MGKFLSARIKKATKVKFRMVIRELSLQIGCALFKVFHLRDEELYMILNGCSSRIINSRSLQALTAAGEEREREKVIYATLCDPLINPSRVFQRRRGRY